MKSLLSYMGYHAKIEFDSEDLVLRGKIEGINDLVVFEAENATQIESEFHLAVDDYLEFCREVGKKPEKEYKGTFNVRISPDLHKKLALKALKNEESLNATVEKAILAYVNEEVQTTNKSDSIYDYTSTKISVVNEPTIDY